VIKLFPVIAELRERLPREALRLICTGQHDALLDLCLDLLGGEPDVRLEVFERGQPLTSLVSRMLSELGEVLRDERPDVLVVQGDTATTMAGALAAFYEGVPVVHVEAGLRTRDLGQPYPEELHRQTVARLASLHLAPTRAARANLVEEGVAEEDISVTGNTGQDALRLAAADGAAPALPGLIPDRPYAVATLHRRENSAHAEAVATGILRGAHAAGAMQVAVVTHPSPEVSTVLRRVLEAAEEMVLSGPLSFPDMVKLCRGARFVVTDSGGIQEEAAALGVPAIVVRGRTEREESVHAGNAVVVNPEASAVAGWMRRLASEDELHASMSRASDVFGDGHAAARVVDAILARFGSRGD
jgi:UDP-N-acetylglucosamine 2-epimerase (non-hydrolysing)